MKVKKVLAGGLAAITAGATLALGVFAGLGDYVDTATSPPFIVAIGNGVDSTDTIAAADLAAHFAGFATTERSTGVSAQVSVAGGADVSTADNKLYMGSVINKAKNTLTSVDLPTLLAKGTVSVQGVAYDYDQYITLGSYPQVTYNVITAASILNPIVYLRTASGTSADGSPTYNATVVFNKPLNVSSANVQNKQLKIFGNEYTIAPLSGATNAGYNPVIIQGFGSTVPVTHGEETVVDVGGTDYRIKVVIDQSSNVMIYVEGVTDGTLYSAGQSTVIEGIDIYVKSVLYVSGTDLTQNSATLSLGSEKITLTDDTTVTKGTSTTVDGTLVDIIGDANGVSKITVSVAAVDSTEAYIPADGSFTDPVFGSFKVGFNGLAPAVDSTARNTLTAQAGTTQASVTFTDYKGNQKLLNFGLDRSGTMALNASQDQAIHVVERTPVSRNDIFLFAPTQESEFGHIFQLKSISGVEGANPKFALEDIVTGTSTTYNIDKSDGITDIYVDGQLIQAINISANQMVFEWGANAQYNVTFPLIKLKNGEYMTLLENSTTLVNSTVYELPGNTTVNLTTAALATGHAAVTAGRITYNMVTSGAGYALRNITSSGGTLMVDQFPAILIMQEKDNTTNKDYIAIEAYERDSTNNYIGLNAPTYSDGTTAVNMEAGSYKSAAVNLFGTYIERYAPAGSGQTVTVKYPDTQAIAAVGVGTNPTFSEGAAGVVNEAMQITVPVARFADDVSTTSPGADLILVGGPCANNLVATLASTEADIPTCADWNLATGLIQEVSNAFGSGKKALVIAGSAASDTRTLARDLIAGTKAIGYSA